MSGFARPAAAKMSMTPSGAADLALAPAILDRDPVHQQAVRRAVARHRLRALGPRQLAEGVVQRLGRQIGIEPCERIAQPLRQDDLAVIVAFGGGLTGRDLRTGLDQPAGAFEPGEGGLFDYRFCERTGNHGKRLNKQLLVSQVVILRARSIEGFILK